jgi:hypothetical protein
MSLELHNELPKDLLAISKDENLLDSPEAYFKAGKDALLICKRIMGEITPSSIIDLPSGYGRVMRYFKNEWPNAKLTAVETDENALQFCKDHFHATPIRANSQMNFEIPNGSDLIFSGSLLTHFDEQQWDKFFDICIKSLSETGTLIFTTHGKINALLAKVKHPMYGNLINLEALYALYLDKQFAYEDYDKKNPGFGFSLSSPSWVMKKLQALPEVRIIFFEEGAWGQDVWAVRRNIDGPMIHS